MIHQAHQPEAELLEGLVPLAIPMGVRNQVKGAHRNPLFSQHFFGDLNRPGDEMGALCGKHRLLAGFLQRIRVA